jgi:hypothetical protein
MKLLQYLTILFLINIWGVPYGFCEEQKRNEKIYIQPNQIHIESNGIFIKLFDEWIMTDSLSVDVNGVYVDHSLRGERIHINWVCPKCSHENAWWRNSCEKCGYR